MAKLDLKVITDVNDQDYEVVEFNGELDKSTIPEAEKKMGDLVSSLNRQYLIIDLRDLHYINSEGIGLMIAIHAKLAKNKKQLFLCGVQGGVSDVFDLVGMDKLIKIFPTAADAVQFIKKT